MDTKELLAQSDEQLLTKMVGVERPTAYSDQVQIILQMRSVQRLIEALNKNSASSDRIATRLNYLTFAIGVATIFGVGAAIIQLFWR
jgi:hypothetical protein